jgi:hypothetical protein
VPQFLLQVNDVPLELPPVIDGRRVRAFLELDLDELEAPLELVWRDHARSSPEQNSGQILSWEVPRNIKGSSLPGLAEKLGPWLRLIHGEADYVAEEDIYTLNEACQSAKECIATTIGKLSVEGGELGVVWPAAKFVPEVVSHDGLSSDMSDEHLERLTDEWLDQAESEGIRIEGSLYDAVFAYRGMLG